jgi:hypothetical protein
VNAKDFLNTINENRFALRQIACVFGMAKPKAMMEPKETVAQFILNEGPAASDEQKEQVGGILAKYDIEMEAVSAVFAGKKAKKGQGKAAKAKAAKAAKAAKKAEEEAAEAAADELTKEEEGSGEVTGDLGLRIEGLVAGLTDITEKVELGLGVTGEVNERLEKMEAETELLKRGMVFIINLFSADFEVEKLEDLPGE